MAANSRTAVKSSVTPASPLSPETKSFRQVQQASEHHCHSNKGSPVSVGAVGWQNTMWTGSCCCPHAAGIDGWNLDRLGQMTYNHRLSGNRRTKKLH